MRTARSFFEALGSRLRHPAILVIALGFAVTACSSSEPAATTVSSPVSTTATVSRRDVRVVEEFDGTLGLSDERSIVYQAEQPVATSTTGAGAGPTGGAPSGSPTGGSPGATTGTTPGGGAGQPGAGGPNATTTTTPRFGGSTTTTSTTTTTAPTTTSTTATPATPVAAGAATTATVSLVSFTAAAQSAPTSGGGGAGGQSDDKTVTSVAAVGSTVSRGQVLYRVDDQPTFVMIGAAPAYRELSTDASDGADVRQLEQNLVELGFGADLTVDDNYTSATASAVSDWEDSVGLDGDGVVELGQIVFTDGPVQVRSITSPVGSMVSIGTEIMTVSSRESVVTIAATLPETTHLQAGTSVDVILDDGTTVPGTVASVGSKTTTADGADVTDSTVELTVSLDDATGSDEATMAGAVTVRATITDHSDVLTVPTSAVMTANGHPVVHVVKGTGTAATASVVQVTVGASADGFVEISGSGVHEGDRVSLVPAESGS